MNRELLTGEPAMPKLSEHPDLSQLVAYSAQTNAPLRPEETAPEETATEETATEEQPTLELVHLQALLPALERLDRLLEHGIQVADATYGSEAASDRYRGLYISEDETARLLRRQPGEPAFFLNGLNGQIADGNQVVEGSRLEWLANSYLLSTFDIDILLIALAPELDKRYERLYAYLQDDVSLRRPGVDLILNLLCSSAAERLIRREHFAPTSPLFAAKILTLMPNAKHDSPTLLSSFVKLDEQIVNFLLHQHSLDRRLSLYGRLVEPSTVLDELFAPKPLLQKLKGLVSSSWYEQQPLRLYLQGEKGSGRSDLVEALAEDAGTFLLEIDIAKALAEDPQLKSLTHLWFREAWFQSAFLLLQDVDLLFEERHQQARAQFCSELEKDTGLVFMVGTAPWPQIARFADEVITVPIARPEADGRLLSWQQHLEMAGYPLDKSLVDTLARRFQLTLPQISQAVAQAATEVGQVLKDIDTLSEFVNHEEIVAQKLFAAARSQSGQEMANLARKVTPIYRWDDIVLPVDTLAQLHELCQRVEHQERVLTEWGFAQKLSKGRGVNTLFAGASGTGKTMAAEVIANELGLDLYQIDLSGVVSKYIGETEKNLDRIFRAAENANAILFFDEADALFGKRSEVRDSHDRYANIEISYLLQKMEEYDGVTILATNLRQNLDEAFTRRLAFTVHFPLPDEESRLRIWETVWPAVDLLSADVELDLFANQFRLSGGNIKNIALAAAYLAAEEGSCVTTEQLLHATQREYQKLGKSLTESELISFSDEVSV